MERTKIHTLTIKQQGEKQLFQIKLPKNAKKIIGIRITTQPIVPQPIVTQQYETVRKSNLAKNR